MRNVLVLCLGLLLGCNNLPTGGSETEVTTDGRNFNSNHSVPSPGDRPAVGGQEPTECETIDITARRVLSVRPGSVTLRVIAAYGGPGDPYVRIVDAASGVHIGDFELGDITLPVSEGSYRWFIFVEVALASGVIQCDGSVSFEIRGEPECDGDCEEEPECTEDCEEEPECEENCEEEPECEVVTGGPFPKQGDPRAECAFFGAVPASPGFYICKAGTEMFSSLTPFSGETCPNGKDISHITTCACPVEE